ncbi:MAG: putative thiamine biosynthesis protein [Bacilli bacterium]|nr:putative thiamine biosynthesis protein [Bacilli bacterium]
MKSIRLKSFTIVALCSLILALTACGTKTTSDTTKLTNVQIVLDWTPNTNHTGIYVAKDQGFYKEAGLNVEIIQPNDSGADTMVASGKVPFGISGQDSITQARTQGVPLVSIAAIIQHNTSGFASPAAKNIKAPKDFVGKTYGSFGSPFESAVLQSLMENDKADFSKLKIVNIGDADYFTATKKDIDFSWIFYAWTGIQAELQKEPQNMLYLKDFSDKLDYYTPVLSTNETMIKEKPEIVKAFVAATAKGYQYAIKNPEKAADMLIKAVPDINKELVIASQKWLSPRYQADAPRWGEQKKTVWDNYADWLTEHKLLEKKLDSDAAFTNQFIPAK